MSVDTQNLSLSHEWSSTQTEVLLKIKKRGHVFFDSHLGSRSWPRQGLVPDARDFVSDFVSLFSVRAGRLYEDLLLQSSKAKRRPWYRQRVRKFRVYRSSRGPKSADDKDGTVGIAENVDIRNLAFIRSSIESAHKLDSVTSE